MHLAATLKQNTKLRSIGLAYNDLKALGVARIAEALTRLLDSSPQRLMALFNVVLLELGVVVLYHRLASNGSLPSPGLALQEPSWPP